MTTPVALQSIGERVQIIATLHALIAFLEANPDLPAPTTVDARFHVHGGTAGGRADVVAAAAAAMEVEPIRSTGGGGYVRAEIPFGPPVGSGSLGFRYEVITHLDDTVGAF